MGMDDADDVAEGTACIEHVWRLANVDFTLASPAVTMEEICRRCGESRLTVPGPWLPSVPPPAD